MIILQVLVCFDGKTGKACQVFDGKQVTNETFEALEIHWEGGMGFYKGQPTAIGGKPTTNPITRNITNCGFSEMLTDEGWREIEKHPR